MHNTKIALVTSLESPKLSDGEKLLYSNLQTNEYITSEVAWDDKNIDWTAFDVVILRACWDYHKRIDEFKQWIESLEKNSVNLWNPINIIKWNIDKHYLIELQEKRVSIIPTFIFNKGGIADLSSIPEINVWGEIIIKPCVGASAWGVSKFNTNNLPVAQQYLNDLITTSDVIVQRFMPQISSEGEYSFMFFNKKYSHTALKRPSILDFRTQPHFGGSEIAVEPPLELITQAQKIVDSIESPLLYARVDGVVENGILMLMELELTEPYLFFELGPQSTDLFIESIEVLAL